MEKTAIKIERQAVISNPEDQQKFSKMTDLRRKIKQILNITKYYQETLKITTTPNAKGYINTLCPFHKDTSPSLSVYTKTGNCICRGACNEKWSIFQFHKKTGKFKTIAKATRNLARLAGVPISNKEVARYSYVDEQREELFHVRKYDNKSIPYRKTPDGKYKSGLKGVQKIPYNLPDVISSRKIYICEGEKDTVNLAKAFGVVSTTFQGANWSDEYQKWFKDKIIRIFPDNDKAGIKFADDVALGLFGIAKSIKIVKLPGLEIKGDVTDWLDNGGTKKEIIKLCKDSNRWAPSQVEIPKAIKDLNEKHAAVMVGGKFRILNENIDPTFNRPDISLSSKHDFLNRYANIKAINPETGKETTIGHIWLKSTYRRSYEGILFEPGNEIPRYYNLWKGLSAKPNKGDWSLFRKHIFNIIADGNEELFKWILAWMANIIQNPGGNRPGTSLVLIGGQGTGKGVFATQFGKLFGSHFLHITNKIQITGRFNQHLKGAVVVFGDEVTWGGEKKTAGILKAMITEDTIQCEPKGVDPYTVKNWTNLIVASNSDWVVPAEIDERRFCVSRVSEKKKQNRRYFPGIIKEMDSGGREAMLYDLLKRDISKINLRKIPRTAALIDQIERSLNNVGRYWFDRLTEGTTISSMESILKLISSMGITKKDRTVGVAANYEGKWLRRVVTKFLYADFLYFQRSVRSREDTPINHFIRKLREYCPGIVTGQKTKLIMPGEYAGDGYYDVLEKRFNAIKIPDLETCRKQFEKKVNSEINWKL